MLGHKTNLNKFRKIEIISSLISDHSAVRLEINYKKKSAKKKNMWRLNNMLLDSQRGTAEIKEEIKKKTEQNKNTMIHNLWETTKTVLREKFILLQVYFSKQTDKKIK